MVWPFLITEISTPYSGQIAIAPQPSNTTDFDQINIWNPDIAVTLTTEAEFPDPDLFLPSQFGNADFAWWHLPIVDYGVPHAKDTALVSKVLNDLSACLIQDGRVFIHCKGGKGRSGMLALRLLIHQGCSPKHGLALLRTVQPHAVETNQQYLWAQDIGVNNA